MRAKMLPHANTTLGKKSLWSAVGKNLLRRAAQSLCSGTVLRIQPWFNQMLELAKGFEPPTL